MAQKPPPIFITFSDIIDDRIILCLFYQYRVHVHVHGSYHWLSGDFITSSTHPVRPDCIDIMYCMGEKVLTGFLLLGEGSSPFDKIKEIIFLFILSFDFWKGAGSTHVISHARRSQLHIDTPPPQTPPVHPHPLVMEPLVMELLIKN